MATTGPGRGVLGQIPNVLSGLRIVLAVAFPFAPPSWRLGLIVAAGLSDGADGILARKLGVTSWQGGILDAVGDKLFTLAVLGTFTVEGRLAWWHLLLVISRDLVVAGIASYAAALRLWGAFRKMAASPLGKLTTIVNFALMVALAAWEPAVGPLLVAAVVLSVLTGVDYIQRFMQARGEAAGRRAEAS
jgi:cardiolipin synthase (CMP-forming)